MRPGTFVISGRDLVTQQQCGAALRRFLLAAGDLKSGDLTKERTEAVWCHSAFDVIEI
ncbi:hypothetical protein ACFQ9V_08570 [Leifsonia sp. NPDC056665]|uniref:hypothetical protein n=1 Tax=Leifsonia sp. NPDC056665 TaxID=3345901 RepID=UPI0036C00D9C